MSFEALPLEMRLLICNNLDVPGLNAMARTCSLMSSLLDPLLYRQAIKNDEYKYRFLYAVIYRKTNAVSKFFKAGVSMDAFEDYIANLDYIKSHALCLEKRNALKQEFHPLLAAAYFGNIDVVRVLLNESNNADHPDIIRLLLEQGARIGEYHELQVLCSGCSAPPPFIHAAKLGNQNAVELMFNKLLQLHNRGNQPELCGTKKAILDEGVKGLCREACYQAYKGEHLDILDFLLYQGADVNFSVEQHPLLYWATTERNISAVKLLVKYGARMECERDCGVVAQLFHSNSWTDNQTQVARSRMNIVMHLLRSGCNVANGGMHACALWALAIYSGARGHRYSGTSRQREEILSLLHQNGFDPKKCQHGCFLKGGESELISAMRGGDLPKYVMEKELLHLPQP